MMALRIALLKLPVEKIVCTDLTGSDHSNLDLLCSNFRFNENEYGDYIGCEFLATSFFYFIFHEGGSVYE